MNETGRISNAQRAYDYIKAEILLDPSHHGSFINEQAVADEVGISRTPVREALRILASEGLVEQIPNRGTMIPIITRKHVEDIMDLRITLETYAAARVLAEETDPVPAMRESIAQQKELAKKPSLENAKKFVKLDQAFHRAIFTHSGNDELTRVYERVSVRQWMIGAKVLQEPARWAAVIKEHEKIVEAFAAKDEKALEEAIRGHLTGTRSTLKSEYAR